MRIKVLLFGMLAAKTGARELSIDLPPGATVDTAMDAVADRLPDVAAMRDRLAMAVDMAYVRGDHPLSDGDELALIPPVSGG
jgi:molybdopterin converting factor subunit 1